MGGEGSDVLQARDAQRMDAEVGATSVHRRFAGTRVRGRRVKCSTPQVIGQGADLWGHRAPGHEREVECVSADGFVRPVVEAVDDGIEVIVRADGQVSALGQVWALEAACEASPEWEASVSLLPTRGGAGDASLA